MEILAIDPGPVETAYVVWNGERITFHTKAPNAQVMYDLRSARQDCSQCVIEKMQSFGMPVGAEVFETVWWSGIFACTFGLANVHRLTRIEVKNHLCHSSRATDANIRQAIIDRFGGPLAIGKKKTPGPLYGISGDRWAALAVALTWWDRSPIAV